MEHKMLPLFTPKNYCDGASQTLDVRITSFCESRCSFCIAATDMQDHRKVDIEAMVEGTKLAGFSEVSIIGGEPLLFLKNLLIYIERVKAEAGIERVYLTTALPYTLVSQRELFEKVMEHITVLNVSLQSYDTEKNNLILKSKKPFDRLVLLEDLLQTKDYADRIRIHLNLSRGGIDSVGELNVALAKLKKLGVQEVKLNELMNAPEEYVSFEEMTGMELDSPYAHGCSTYVDYYPGIKTLLKRSCFVVEKSREPTVPDALKYMWKAEKGYLDRSTGRPRVLYEDGGLTTRWQGETL